MSASSVHDPFATLTAECTSRGMNLVGAVDAAAFDATQPCGRRAGERLAGCDTIVLLGAGGRAAWEAVQARQGGSIGPARPGYHPIDAWSLDVAEQAAEQLRTLGCEVAVVPPDEQRPMNFRQLAEQVGFGTVSPVIGHLLHPEFGPWLSLRPALLVRGRPFGPRPPAPLGDFAPCGGCPQPCRAACPSGTYRQPGSPDLLACAEHRLEGGCGTGCDTLRACPLGAEHRYGPEEEAFRHAYSLFRTRRWLGTGLWRFVPRRFRQG
ncbi:MAG: hypothetical protein ACO4CZ_09200 [Planctomycetota bacterium]